jgi:hypothetical protein
MSVLYALADGTPVERLDECTEMFLARARARPMRLRRL